MDRVDQHMSKPVLTVRPDERLDIARALMCACRCRHLAAVDRGVVVGVLSDGDLLAAAPSAVWPDERARAVALAEIAVESAMKKPVATAAPDEPLVAAAERMERRRIGCLPVVDGGALVGIVTRTDLLRAALAGLAREPRPPTVARLMTRVPVVVAPHDPIPDAWTLMKGARIRHLPVVDGARVVGLLSRRDLLAAIGDRAPAHLPRPLTVAEVMSAPAITVDADRRALEAGELLCRRRLGALPVTRAGRLVGMVAVTDFLYYLASLPEHAAGARR